MCVLADCPEDDAESNSDSTGHILGQVLWQRPSEFVPALGASLVAVCRGSSNMCLFRRCGVPYFRPDASDAPVRVLTLPMRSYGTVSLTVCSVQVARELRGSNIWYYHLLHHTPNVVKLLKWSAGCRWFTVPWLFLQWCHQFPTARSVLGPQHTLCDNHE